jgi:hypothetical protein
MRVVGAARQLAIDRDQVLHRRHLRRQDDAIMRQADLLGAFGDSSAGRTMASCVTSRASRGLADLAFSSISRISSS